MVAPMPLTTYEETRPWVKSIAREVGARRMPPWKASAEFHGVFSNERGLNATEIATIEKWIAAGARQGRPEDAPPPVVFPNLGGWRIAEPDLIVKFEKPFHVADDAEDLYANVTVTLTEAQLPENRWIKAIEWKGGSSAVHHIVGHAMAPGEGGRTGVSYGLGSIAPGEEPVVYPDGYAKLLIKGSRLLFNMHYHKAPGPGTAVDDVSMVAFKFHPKDATITHFVEHNAIGSHTFELPPGNASWKIGAARTFEADTTILTLHPHMHLRGKDARYVAFYPNGRRETLLHVPAWDFSWQTDYSFREPKKIPAGTRIEYTAIFDNSPGNPANPNPQAAVAPGGKTTDEMMLGYLTFTESRPREISMESALQLMKASRRSRGESQGDESR
jgi:hypothetical protein